MTLNENKKDLLVAKYKHEGIFIIIFWGSHKQGH